jgi:hypothetical protein
MQATTFIGTVRLEYGALQDVTVQAANSGNARWMLEAQYGKGYVFGVAEVREEPAERGNAAENRSIADEKPASRGEVLALCLGIAVFFLLYALGVDWKWALGIAVPIWLVLGIRAAR